MWAGKQENKIFYFLLQENFQSRVGRQIGTNKFSFVLIIALAQKQKKQKYSSFDLCHLVSHAMSPHPSDQLSERSNVSMTARQML